MSRMRIEFEKAYAAAQVEQHGPLAEDPFGQDAAGAYLNSLVQSCWWGYQNGWAKAVSVLANDGLDVLLIQTASASLES